MPRDTITPASVLDAPTAMLSSLEQRGNSGLDALLDAHSSTIERIATVLDLLATQYVQTAHYPAFIALDDMLESAQAEVKAIYQAVNDQGGAA